MEMTRSDWEEAARENKALISCLARHTHRPTPFWSYYGFWSVPKGTGMVLQLFSVPLVASDACAHLVWQKKGFLIKCQRSDNTAEATPIFHLSHSEMQLQIQQLFSNTPVFQSLSLKQSHQTAKPGTISHKLNHNPTKTKVPKFSVAIP